MRQTFEFQCTECHKYFDVKLNVSLNGNYRIHCPQCSHIHYRQIKDGKITDIRFTQSDDQILIEDIRPMKSSCRDVQKEKFVDASNAASGFMRRLWKEKFSWQT